MKMHIEKDTVQETLVIPLYGRKICTELYPELFQDTRASALIEKIDYDFSALEKKSKGFMGRFGSLEIAMRQKDLAMEAQEYLREHPKASVVNLGCGLDETAEICDNGQCRIYNLDFPDIIEIRNQLIPPGERTQNLAADLNDFAWMDQVEHQDGVVFLASGVFYYFKREQMQKLLNAMAQHFKGGKVVFDSAGKTAVKIMMKSVIKESGIQNIEALFYVNDLEKDLKPWLKNAKASSRGYMLGYDDLRHPSIKKSFRFLAGIGDNRLKMQIIRIDFDL